MDKPTRVTLSVHRAGDYWDVDLITERDIGLITESGHHYARGATILRTVAMTLFDAGLVCPAHYNAVMATHCGDK